MRFLLFAFIFPLISFSQELPLNKDGKIEFTEVVNVDGANASDLYGRAKLYSVIAFRSAEENIQMDDESSKQISIKGNMQIATTEGKYYGIVTFKILIQCKDGRYKYTYLDFVHKYINPGGHNLSGGLLDNETPENPLSQEVFNLVKTITAKSVNTHISSLKEIMSKKESW